MTGSEVVTVGELAVVDVEDTGEVDGAVGVDGAADVLVADRFGWVVPEEEPDPDDPHPASASASAMTRTSAAVDDAAPTPGALDGRLTRRDTRAPLAPLPMDSARERDPETRSPIATHPP